MADNKSMDNKSIKVSASSYYALKELSKIEKESIQAIVEKILKEYQVKKFFEQVKSSYENMSDADWQDEMEERKLFEGTLTDGMEDEADETW